jgi:very-short-patch-repair endonuclease
MIIELDGGVHAQTVAYDADRDAWFEGQGFRVMRFSNGAALENLSGLADAILQAVCRDEDAHGRVNSDL